MIEVTERAKHELKKILSANVDNPLAGLRLSATEQNRLGLGLDIEASGDTVVEHEGSKVLMVEGELADGLRGISVDIEDTQDGPRLVIVNEP